MPHPNLLLSALPQHDLEHFLVSCEPITLLFGEVLQESQGPIRHLYFPSEGFISITSERDKRTSLEVGLIGNEGMFGNSLILGVKESPFHALVQGSGPSLRIETSAFFREYRRSPTLQNVLKRYLYVSIRQLAQMAVCTRFHLVEARVARWLLMTQDRSHSDQIHLTHEFLAGMLGVRRVGVTKAASSLQSKGLISYNRGDITILDRHGLTCAACACYEIDKATYARTMPMQT